MRVCLLKFIAAMLWFSAGGTNLPAQNNNLEVRRQLAAGDPTAVRVRHTLSFEGREREYFIQLPSNYERGQTYWLLVAAHGGSGNGNDAKVGRYGHWAEKLGLEAIVVTPSFHQTDAVPARFPDLGEGDFLKAIIAEMRMGHQLRDKILLTGYSRGGQFSHRFALRNPDLVFAAAPQAAGTWTTPDGRFLMDLVGEIEDPATYLTTTDPSSLRANLRDNFDPRVAKAAGLPAKPGAEKIPFHVMCGTLDSRVEIARTFVASLVAHGYDVESEWPRSPHGPAKVEHVAEWEKFRRRAIEFFVDVTDGQ